MLLKFQGLNSIKRLIDNLNIINKPNNEETDLNNFYLTFDSIYYLNKDNKIYIFDFQTENFIKLDFLSNQNIFILDLATNSSFLWVLIKNEESQQLELLQFNKNILVEKFKLDSLIKNQILNDLVLQATDINVYLFQNSNETGLICIYEHKSKNELTKKCVNFESKLNESAISSLVLNKIILNEKISQFSSGKEHILMLTEKSNQVYSFGIGLKGQLGHGVIENLFEPKLIATFKNKIVKIAAGGWHSGAIDDRGQVYMWGWNSQGQIGIDHPSAFISSPTKLEILNEFTNQMVKFKILSLGARHSALIDIDNNLYAFGWNKYGQIFNENNKFKINADEDLNIEEPMLLMSYKKITKDVKCGSWFNLTLLSTKTE